MPDDLIQVMRDAHAKTTQGKWFLPDKRGPLVDNSDGDTFWSLDMLVSSEEDDEEMECMIGMSGHCVTDLGEGEEYCSRENMEFSALAHNRLPELLDRLEKAEGKLEAAAEDLGEEGHGRHSLWTTSKGP